MPILDQCEEFFGTRDIYVLLKLEKSADEKDIKKAYYKLSLEVHPDRVAENLKAEATEKFKVLSKLYQVLTDKDKRALYDEQGVIDDEDDEGKLSSWLDLWRKIFKPITTEEISEYEKSYIGSDLELRDIKKAYLAGKGCINYIMNAVPFFKVEDEPRLHKIVQEWIDAGEVPAFKNFTNEPTQKRKRRHNKYSAEAKEAELIKKKMEQKGESSLEQQLMERQRARESGYNSLMSKLLDKYGGEDESDVIDFKALDKKTKKKKSNSAKKQEAAEKLHAVKQGRVKKPKN